MARVKESNAVVPTTDKEKALAIVSAFFDGKNVERSKTWGWGLGVSTISSLLELSHRVLSQCQ